MSLLPLIFATEPELARLASPSRFERDLLLNSLQQLQEMKREFQARASVNVGEDGFKVNLDVQQFRPDEVTVKVVDKHVVVEAKHEERKDEHGFISRSFVRRYAVPEDIDIDQVASTLSSDGVLSILAPKKRPVPLPGPNERVVPITRTTSAIKQAADKTAAAPAEEKPAN